MKLEYGLLVALIASVIVIAMTHTSVVVASPFDVLSEKLAPLNTPKCDGEQAVDISE